MPSSPLILLVHEMHESGIDLLREAGELRMASGTDPATLQREVVGAKALVIRTRRGDRRSTHGQRQGSEGHRPAWCGV